VNFRPELAAKVMAGEKTVTRRLVSSNPRSPWYRGRCRLQIGRDYAICPGRGKDQIGRVLIIGTSFEELGYLTEIEARKEGFANRLDFEIAWLRINGCEYNPRAMVWRVAFRAVTPHQLTVDEVLAAVA
jgi:hypothetical protein